MNNVKLIPYKIYVEKYQTSASIDEELRDWKSVNAPHLQGLIYKDSSDARFLVTLPPNPVFMFGSSEDFKKFALKKRERRGTRKSTYEGMIPDKQAFLASMDGNRNILAKQLNLSQAQLNYNLESIVPLLDALKNLPEVHDFNAEPDRTLFLLVQYIGNTIYTQRKQKWSFRKQHKYDVLIPDIVYVGVNSTPYDWFINLTSTVIERRFDELPYIIESAIGKQIDWQ